MTDITPEQARDEAMALAVVAERVPAHVVTIEDYNTAADVLRDIKTAAQGVKKTKESITKPLNEALRHTRSLFAPIEGQLSDAETTVKARMADYIREQDRIAAEQAEEADEERAYLEAQAMRAVEDGRYEDADLATTTLDAIPDPIPAYKARDERGYKPAQGVQSSRPWKAEVTDLRALVTAVAAGDAPLDLLTVDGKALRALCLATKDENLAPPGTRFFQEIRVSAAAKG